MIFKAAKTFLTDVFTPDVSRDDMLRMFQTEFRTEYNFHKKFGTPITKKMIIETMAR